MVHDKQKRWLPAIVAGLVLVGVAAWVSVLLPMEPTALTEQAGEREVPQKRWLGEWQGQVALFETGCEEPIEVYEVDLLTLPEEEQTRIREGIAVEDEEMLAELLENYTS